MITDRGIWTSTDETKTHLVDLKICQWLVDFFRKENRIVDLGCGNGGYTKYLIDNGFYCEGYDGSPLTPDITNGLCRILDLSEPIDIGKFDVCLCLEVGEHIPQEYEQTFIDNICNSSKRYIILSWAIEGQPGYGHVNCKNNEYIIDQICSRGFRFVKENTNWIRRVSELPWFKDTLIFFEYDYGRIN